MAQLKIMAVAYQWSGLVDRLRRPLDAILAFGLIAALGACTTVSSIERPQPLITPLELADRTVELSEVASIAPTPDLLALDAEMRAFVRSYTGGLRTDRQRLTMLHKSIKGAGALNMRYVADAEGVAADVFYRGTANCLSYAHLFVALAREAGLDAQYHWLEVRPQWSRIGNRVAVRLHVNVVVNLRRGEQFMVDIDPLEAAEVKGSRVISDLEAAALYHNNIAMDALAAGQMESAWGHAVQAIQLSPEMPHLWVNLGAIYRLAGQHREAEESYLYALELNPRDRSAMNNLLVLYEIEGREEDRQLWASRVARYRAKNPYYHAWLGDKAGEEEDWHGALEHYSRAVKLLPQESNLQYAMGLIHYKLGDFEEAALYINTAIETATLHRDAENYRRRLEAIERERTARAL